MQPITKILLSTMATAAVLASCGEKQDQKADWGLVYDGAITENVPGAVNLHPVNYDLRSIADSKYMSDEAFEKATGTSDKEYFIIEGATHIRTYFVPEYVEQISAILTEFFGPRL